MVQSMCFLLRPNDMLSIEVFKLNDRYAGNTVLSN